MVTIELEVPEGVRSKPVVVSAVDDHGVVVADALSGQERLELLLVDEVAADRVLKIGLPIDAHGIANVVDLVSGGVFVDFDKHNLGVINVGFNPVSIDE